MKSKNKILILCFVALLLLSISFTLAYLQLQSELNNRFNIGTVTPEIIETFNNNIKSDVAVKNNGNVSVYVRCKVIFYFETNAGNISSLIPKESLDYNIQWGNKFKEDWIQIGDIYYYKKPLQAGEQTSNLIEKCTSLNNKKLVVDISAQSIQVKPEAAVNEAWTDVMVTTNGNLQINGGKANVQ